MNPIFGRMMGGMNQPVSNVMNMIQQIRQMQQNPNQLASLLLNNNKITREQYEEIKNYNPQQIGEYLMKTGSIPQQQVQQAYQNIVPQVQQQLKDSLK